MASQVLNHVSGKLANGGSYANNPAVGPFLIERIFKPGSRYHWNKMLQNATGENLNPEHFVGQFIEQP